MSGRFEIFNTPPVVPSRRCTTLRGAAFAPLALAAMANNLTREIDVRPIQVSAGVPACPACREANHIEPLLRHDDVWHVRCLKCGYGFTFVQTAWPASQERRRGGDRREVPRSGRRSTDLSGPVTCGGCASVRVRGWLRTADGLWARCEDCGRVQRCGAGLSASARK